MSEKILSAKSGQDARAGELVVCRVDYALGTDGSVPMAISYFHEMNGHKVNDPAQIIFALDHYAPTPNPKTHALHETMRTFAKEHGIFLHELAEGIGHQLMVETGRSQPGGLLVGADSHSVTYGACNAFATGIGSSDLAAVMISGRIWLKVPETIKVTLVGSLARGVYPKDIALAMTRDLRSDGATYEAIEFQGPGVASLDLEDRMVICNMVVEMGAKNGIFPADVQTRGYLQARGVQAFTPVEADGDASYTREITLDLSQLKPQIAKPHHVDNVVDIGDLVQTPVQMVLLGTCTGGRVKDYHQALAVLKAGGGIAPGVQVVVTPASREIFLDLMQDGTLAALTAMGAVVTTPGCGSCCGTCGAIPGDDVNVISTANRNFKGRMGNAKSYIYLASPASCAAAAVTGQITDPREVLA
jgi:3-isopropylmalate/(R)-2-methylmalate dehydratase large subunit